MVCVEVDVALKNAQARVSFFAQDAIVFIAKNILFYRRNCARLVNLGLGTKLLDKNIE
jgi:hypothetical protein